jgi:DNA polymerase-1
MAKNGFNVNSKQMLGWLLYDKLGNPVLVFTETGRPAVSRKVLPSLGEPGKLLSKYNLYKKRLGYVEAMIAKTARDGILHPQFNSVGTVTGRLGGSGGLNMQQMPKVAEFLAALRARPGHKLVQADAEALEPVILAEFSQDATLLKLYGPNAKPNDIYLFVGAKLPGLGDAIRKYYDPDDPTPEGITTAKEHCKKERAVAKIVVLAANYNAGPLKIQETLKFAGIDLTVPEVRKIHLAYWRLFSGVKRFEEKLHDMWTVRSGWIPSILGTPICVDAEYVKDIVNRFCQTSGHQVLQLWISHIARLREERGVTMYPWLVDFHDETIWEVPEDQAEAAAQILREALVATNEEIAMGIPIKGPPMIVDNLAQIKDPGGYEKWLAERQL